jgi:DNA-directed RNA polymerase alpha subunit
MHKCAGVWGIFSIFATVFTIGLSIMEKEELLRKLSRLNEIVSEAKEIVNEIETFSRDAYYSQYDDISIAEIQLGTKAITTRFHTVCRNNGHGQIETLGDLLKRKPSEVARYRDLGKKCIEQLQQFILREYDVEWK